MDLKFTNGRIIEDLKHIKVDPETLKIQIHYKDGSIYRMETYDISEIDEIKE